MADRLGVAAEHRIELRPESLRQTGMNMATSCARSASLMPSQPVPCPIAQPAPTRRTTAAAADERARVEPAHPPEQDQATECIGHENVAVPDQVGVHADR